MELPQARETASRGLVLASLLVLGLAVSTGVAAAHGGDDGVHHHDGWMGTHGGMGSWMGGGFALVWLLLMAVLVLGLPLVGYLWLTRGDGTGGTTDDALAVLRRRYAEGDLTDEEFESRRMKLVAEQD